MKNESKQSPKSGSAVSESTEKSPVVAGNGVVKLMSLLEGGGDHPDTGLSVPKAGEIFEADEARGLRLVACGLAVIAGDTAQKGE